MAEPVNLNKFRKAKQKSDARAQASENRVAFGRTKAEKDASKLDAKKASDKLDGAKRGPPKN